MNQMELSYFETKGAASVPLVFSMKDHIFGFLINEAEAPTQSTIKSAQALLERNPMANIYVLSRTNNVRKLMDRVVQVPLLAVI